MRKQIKKYGNTHVVSFTAEDMLAYNLQDGDIVDITITRIDGKKGGKQK